MWQKKPKYQHDLYWNWPSDMIPSQFNSLHTFTNFFPKVSPYKSFQEIQLNLQNWPVIVLNSRKDLKLGIIHI